MIPETDCPMKTPVPFGFSIRRSHLITVFLLIKTGIHELGMKLKKRGLQ